MKKVEFNRYLENIECEYCGFVVMSIVALTVIFLFYIKEIL